MLERNNERVVEIAVQARQGRNGHRVRYVLAFGIGSVIVTFAIICFLFFQ
jgi:hypothetical protein